MVIGERYDRVTYLRQAFPNIEFVCEHPVFVESGRFIPLIPFIKKMVSKDSYLAVYLKNGAEYKLPYLEIEFSRPEMPDNEEPVIQIQGRLNLSTLKKTALQNLVKPEMRCIYVDNRGAVTCNFLQGTVDTNIRSVDPILLPPDLITYLSDEESVMICTIGDYIFYTNNSDCQIWAPKGDFSQEEEELWYETIYASAMSVQNEPFTELPDTMEEVLKRLSLFGNDVVFLTDKVVVGDNFEPLNIPSAKGSPFTLEEVSSVISCGKEIYFTDTSMFLRKGGTTVLVSVKEEE